MVKVNGFDAKFWTFPGGERSVKLTKHPLYYERTNFLVTMEFKGSDDLIDLVLTVNALRHMMGADIKLSLNVPYLPFSRQDRVMTEGESFGLQAAVAMINMCNFTKVTTWDVHSDVAGALFPACVFHNIHQEVLWEDTVKNIDTDKKVAIVSPDAGALKKIYKVAAKTGRAVVEAMKVRDVATGAIVETRISAEAIKGFDTLIIVDDICDGGRTFIELGKVIRDAGFTGRLVLCVTHGIFSKGTAGFSDFDDIATMNNINEVDLKKFKK